MHQIYAHAYKPKFHRKHVNLRTYDYLHLNGRKQTTDRIMKHDQKYANN